MCIGGYARLIAIAWPIEFQTNGGANGTQHSASGGSGQCCTPDDPASTGGHSAAGGRSGGGYPPRHYSPQPPSAAACKLYSSHPIRNHNAERSIQSKRKVIQMLFVIVLEFFVCWVPLWVLESFPLIFFGKLFSRDLRLWDWKVSLVSADLFLPMLGQMSDLALKNR